MNGLRRTRWARALALPALALAMVPAVACGDDDDASDRPATAGVESDALATDAEAPAVYQQAAPPVTAVEVTASGEPCAVEPSEVTVPSGVVKLVMTNASGTPLALAMDEPERATGEPAAPGGVSEITVDLPVGDHAFYCADEQGRQAGQAGTIVVE